MSNKKRYEKLWRNKYITSEANNIAEMIKELRKAADKLQQMADAGVNLYTGSDIYYDHALLMTDNAEVAMDFGFRRENDMEDPAQIEEEYNRRKAASYPAYCEGEVNDDLEDSFEEQDDREEDMDDEDDGEDMDDELDLKDDIDEDDGQQDDDDDYNKLFRSQK